MRKLDKGSEPAILAKNASQWLGDLREARRAKVARAFKRCQGRYANAKVRDALNISHRNKCAYCEAMITHIAPTHIEHFRPKSKYCALTFSWSNLLLSCPICNDAGHKGSKFPKERDGGPLVKPDTDDPSDHFSFQWEITTSEALIRPKTSRGEITCKILGLNRLRLVKYRSEYLKKLLLINTYAKTDAEAAGIIQEALSEDAQFCAFARAYFCSP